MLIYEMDTVIVDDYRLRRTGWPGHSPYSILGCNSQDANVQPGKI